jgi:hypothetical protein
MTEFDLPIVLSFNDHHEASAFVESLEQAKEQVIWEQRAAEDGTVMVTVLNIINLEEKQERKEEENAR